MSLVTVSFCRIGHVPNMPEYTKNFQFNPRNEKHRHLLAAMGITAPFKEQYIIEVRAKEKA